MIEQAQAYIPIPKGRYRRRMRPSKTKPKANIKS
jgi:hypothetical protein